MDRQERIRKMSTEMLVVLRNYAPTISEILDSQAMLLNKVAKEYDEHFNKTSK